MPNKIFSLIKAWVRALQKFFSSIFWQRVMFVLLGTVGVGMFFLLFYFAGLSKVYGVLLGLTWWQLAAIPLFVMVTYLIAAWRWLVILRGFGYQTNFMTLVRIIYKSAAVSLLVPSFEISGETFKALRLKQHQVSAPASFASAFFDYFVNLVITLLLSSFLIIYVIFQGFFPQLGQSALCFWCWWFYIFCCASFLNEVGLRV